jgi:hypothetical protein
MERCSVCVLPRSYAAVSFGEDGICNLCRDHATAEGDRAQRREEAARRLEALVSDARGRDAAYDCVVPVSGGRDSAFVAYVMRRRFGLRVLGVNFDNGYRSTQAVANLDALATALDMDLVTLRVEPGLMRRMFAHFLRECGYFCTVCNAVGYFVIGSFAAREAARIRRPLLVVGGWSKKYEHQPGVSELSIGGFLSVLRRDDGLYAALLRNPLVEEDVIVLMSWADDPRQTLAREDGSGSGIAGIRLVQLPDCMDWDYDEIERTLRGKLDWRAPSKGPGAHFDCTLGPVQEYLKTKKHGFAQGTIRDSVLVREGRMTREEALRRAEAEQRDEPPMMGQVLGDWGMTRDQIAWDADWV